MDHNLAFRMRPQVIDDIVGQQHLIGPEQIIWRMVQAKRLASMILYGQPGIGKTSIASALSGSTGIPFKQFNASIDDKKKLQGFAKEIEKTKEPLIILLDEIHRLDKPKQDFLLPYMESGEMIIIGATTENPYISVQPAIRSRAQIFELKPVNADDLLTVLQRAINDSENGLGNYPLVVEDNVLTFLSTATNGDVRSALNALEIAALSTAEENGTITITQTIIEQCIQLKAIDGDASGDAHYNVISALQKSIRGSDTDAALHYLARLLEAGDLITAMRRLTIIAFEDVGLADPTVWSQVMAAVEAAKTTGLPEARIPLADAVVLMCLSPKSNVAYKALDAASSDLNMGLDLTIPSHLKDAHYKGAKALGNGVGYLYPHDYPYAMVKQQYLPDSLKNKRYLEFKDSSPVEDKLHQRYNAIKQVNNE